ncbi:hypothetical protein FMM05_08850 [Flavobacterium zepuense]|uniref:Quercetin 2,3-dioxygenase C-terminal cupin domain-containing protein n=1 Tax=Flavobacterium zepuense TaxID=2593302 RepID=A0A552V2E0_9FLAO|nr:hypothetical protein [Flavobacterium zepuense]TRW24611.1 hypothetical protein FMM05_08850 [Flavobacterium zepuense]
MIRQSPAQMYTAKQRGHTEDSLHRLLATFNFGAYADDTRNPFGSLAVVNDETLAPHNSISRNVGDATTLLIPLVGSLYYSLGAKEQVLMPGEALIISPFEKGTVLELKNPYDGDLVNYLFIVFRGIRTVNFGINRINLDVRNRLHGFVQQSVFGYMGIFDGRREALYNVKDSANGLFAFVINGSFEVNGRLLEERDALALWDTNEADIEALSENAIILLFEVPITRFTA